MYGTLNDYRTGSIIRSATRADWLRGRAEGDSGTGAHEADGVRVFIDGPDEDPEQPTAALPFASGEKFWVTFYGQRLPYLYRRRSGPGLHLAEDAQVPGHLYEFSDEDLRTAERG